MPWTCFRKRLTLKEKVGQGKKKWKDKLKYYVYGKILKAVW